MVKNNYLRWFLYTIGSALSFALAWIPFNITPLIVVSFFLFLLLEQEIRKYNKHWVVYFLFLIVGSFTLNFLTTYWIWNASPGGAVFAWLFDTFLMIIPLLVFYFVNKKTGKSNYWIFITLWISIELLHTNWQFAYPWLVVGNVFSAWPKLIQWYEYTGVFGGSFWVLITSVACLKLYNYYREFKSIPFKKIFNQLFIYILTPLFVSFYILTDRHAPRNIVENYSEITIVQPNIDPYKDKFGGLTPLAQTQKMLAMAQAKLKPESHIIILPETAIQDDIDELNIYNSISINLLDSFTQNHAGLSILTGASSYKFYFNEKDITPTARFYQNNLYYDYFNAAFFKNSLTPNWTIYHKSKLVPGVENMPYVNIFSFLKNFVIDLGGTSGGLGCDKIPTNFTDVNKVQYAPVICYESVFGEYVSEYVKKGANIICVITNDGWWGNTAGYKQHYEYAKLRAIENRRYVARSANTGISGFIDDEGNSIQQTKWDEAIAINGKVKINTEITFYTKHGDFIGYMAAFYLLFNLPMIFGRRRK
ncbi:MAG: apolipoprotein N-acyltransferase [Bacteroidia bacterium]|nr:apolipoprotein N-acyltransferase [Bacteroidia bacterium]